MKLDGPLSQFWDAYCSSAPKSNLAPGTCQKRQAPTSCIQLQLRAEVAYLGRARSARLVSRRSSGTR